MSRLDIMQPRQGGDGKTYWTKLGSAWPNKQGVGYSLTFEALPMPAMNDKGQVECRVLLREPLPPRDGYDASPQRRTATTTRAPAAFDDDLDDAGGVPF